MATSTEGAKADLWGTLPRHYTRVNNHKASCFGSVKPTLTASAQSLRSLVDSARHSRLTMGFVQPFLVAGAAYAVVVKNVRRRAKNTLLLKVATIVSKPLGM